MKTYLLLFSAVAVTALSGCAIGPLLSHETARTVGKSNHELVAGGGNVGYVFKWNYGLTDNLDLGLHWEQFSVGIRGKYAFINSKEGWSLAGALGTGASIGGKHYYGDVIGSYLVGKWEPYGTVRIVRVQTDPLEFKDEDTGHVDFTVDKMQYDYGQVFLGSRYWFTPHWLFSVEASTLFAMSSGVKISDTLLFGASFGYRF